MDEIRRRDLRVFSQEALKLSGLFGLGLSELVILPVATGMMIPFSPWLPGILTVAAYLGVSYRSSTRKRFISHRFAYLWDSCSERLQSFHGALKQLKKAEIAEFSEMPLAIQEVADSLYKALRRADLIYDEVARSEHGNRRQLAVPPQPFIDPQSTELYRIADKNLAEYRANYSDLMAGIQRTEAQATVFITTLDSLRVKMLGFRLAGKTSSLKSGDFLASLAEARLQLESIDKALDELDLGHYPTTIAVVKPEVSLQEVLDREPPVVPHMIPKSPVPPADSQMKIKEEGK